MIACASQAAQLPSRHDHRYDDEVHVVGPVRGQAVTPVDWLRGMPGGYSRDPAREADSILRHLRRLDAVEARLDLALGEGLALLLPTRDRAARFDLRALGHSHARDFTGGRLGMSVTHARELVRLAARLPELPELRTAFLSGLIRRSRLRTVLDVATAEDEGAWAELARSRSTRELATIVRDVKAGRREALEGARAGSTPEPAAPDDDDEPVVIVWSASASEAATWRHGLAAVRQIMGGDVPEHVAAEVLSAEMLTMLEPELEPEPEPEPQDEPAASSARQADGALAEVTAHPSACWHAEAGKSAASVSASRRRRRSASRRLLSDRQRRRLHRKLKKVIARTWGDDNPARSLLDPLPPPLRDLPRFDDCRSAADVLQRLQALERRRRALSWERGRLLCLVRNHELHRAAGHAEYTELTLHRLGLGPKEAIRLAGLSQDVRDRPVLNEAWRDGQLTVHAAARLHEISWRENDAQWVRYARTVTPKQLDAAIERARLENDPQAPPPWDAPHRELLLDWQHHFGLRRRDVLADRAWLNLKVAGGDDELEGGARAAIRGRQRPETPPAASSAFRLGRVRFEAPPSVATQFWEAIRGVQRLVDAAEVPDETGRHPRNVFLTVAEAVETLIRHFLSVHASAEVLKTARRHRALERDGWVCTMPHCRARLDLHEHHVIFRSHVTA